MSPQNHNIGNLFHYQGLEKILTYYRTLRARDLTQSDIRFLRRAGVINGCGGNPRNKRIGTVFARAFAWIASWLARCLAPAFITASCELHDFGYWKGGDEERRADCDWRFYEAIISDVGVGKYGLLRTCYYAFLALLFYVAVRLGGKAYFNYL